MNTIQITGRLTADPELRGLPSGEKACRLRLAVEGMSRNRETGYINVTSFGPSGEAAARTLTKGWLVAVAGRLDYHDWQTDTGSKRHEYEIVGNVEFLAAPRGDGLTTTSRGDTPTATGAQAQSSAGEGPADESRQPASAEQQAQPAAA